MARHDALYQRALYYDIALRRDVGAEVDFIVDVFRQHAGRPLQSVLELGCGPGYHARGLASRGLTAYGLDISEAMIDLARELSADDPEQVNWLVADMAAFTLEAPVDMAVCMFDGIDVLLTDRDFQNHLERVALHLVEGGLYLIDCTHPRDCSITHYGDYSYNGSRDDIEVEIIWGTNNPQIDPVTGIAEVATRMVVNDRGNHQVIEDIARERCFTAQQLRLLVEKSGSFSIAEWYGDFAHDQPLDNSPQSKRMIALLRRNPVLP